MKLLFCGTPEFAVPTLRRVREAGHEVAAVVTQPDRPRGRGRKLAAPPVKQAAGEVGLAVEQPEKFKGEAGQQILARYRPDAVVIVGYGQIIPGDLLGVPRHGWINLHASLLPKYRGAAPVQWAVMRGETKTGVTTMQLDEGLDTGPVFLQREEPIRDEDTAETLGARLAELGARLMGETLQGIEAGTLVPRPQEHHLASKAPLLKKEHGRTDWSRPAGEIYNRIRGLLPWPGAYTTFRGKTVHLWWGKPGEKPAAAHQNASPGTLFVEKHALYVACGPAGGGLALKARPEGARNPTWLRLEELQPADRKRMRATDFINGLHPRTGEKFENPN